jgi:hypothetical protein
MIKARRTHREGGEPCSIGKRLEEQQKGDLFLVITSLPTVRTSTVDLTAAL